MALREILLEVAKNESVTILDNKLIAYSNVLFYAGNMEEALERFIQNLEDSTNMCNAPPVASMLNSIVEDIAGAARGFLEQCHVATQQSRTLAIFEKKDKVKIFVPGSSFEQDDDRTVRHLLKKFTEKKVTGICYKDSTEQETAQEAMAPCVPMKCFTRMHDNCRKVLTLGNLIPLRAKISMSDLELAANFKPGPFIGDVFWFLMGRAYKCNMWTVMGITSQGANSLFELRAMNIPHVRQFIDASIAVCFPMVYNLINGPCGVDQAFGELKQALANEPTNGCCKEMPAAVVDMDSKGLGRREEPQKREEETEMVSHFQHTSEEILPAVVDGLDRSKERGSSSQEFVNRHKRNDTELSETAFVEIPEGQHQDVEPPSCIKRAKFDRPMTSKECLATMLAEGKDALDSLRRRHAHMRSGKS